MNVRLGSVADVRDTWRDFPILQHAMLAQTVRNRPGAVIGVTMHAFC